MRRKLGRAEADGASSCFRLGRVNPSILTRVSGLSVIGGLATWAAYRLLQCNKPHVIQRKLMKLGRAAEFVTRTLAGLPRDLRS